jgi:hypothetical protein
MHYPMQFRRILFASPDIMDDLSLSGGGRERAGSHYLSYDLSAQPLSPFPAPKQSMPKNLGEVLGSPFLRHKFRQFLKDALAVESLLFYESAELFAKIDDPKWAKTAAADIVSKFIAPGGMYEINISADARDALVARKTYPGDCFDDAKAEVYRLLKENFFASFVAREFLMAST